MKRWTLVVKGILIIAIPFFPIIEQLWLRYIRYIVGQIENLDYFFIIPNIGDFIIYGLFGILLAIVFNMDKNKSNHIITCSYVFSFIFSSCIILLNLLWLSGHIINQILIHIIGSGYIKTSSISIIWGCCLLKLILIWSNHKNNSSAVAR